MNYPANIKYLELLLRTASKDLVFTASVGLKGLLKFDALQPFHKC